MAKQKTKQIPFDKTATEVEPGVWTWKVGETEWRWTNQPGLNLEVMKAGQWMPCAYVDKLEKAALFAEGSAFGKKYLE